MNEEIEKIFNRKIKIDNKEIPIEYMDYQGKKEEYVIYFNNGSLQENDFSWQSDEGDKYESDTKYHHFISNFKKIVYRREK